MRGKVVLIVLVSILALTGSGFHEVEAGPPGSDILSPGNLGLSSEDGKRAKALELWTAEIEAGITDVRQLYMGGAHSPALPGEAIDFLLFSAQVNNKTERRDLALGATAVYHAMNGNGYMKVGVPVGPKIYEKRSADQARMLTALTEAWRVSGKELFKTAALKIGDDLQSWAVYPGKSGTGIIRVSLPDSLVDGWTKASPDLPAPETIREEGSATQLVFKMSDVVEANEVAASLLENGLALERPKWVESGRKIAMAKAPAPKVKVASNPARRLETARYLLAVIQAASARPHPTWNDAAAYWAKELTAVSQANESPLDPVSGGWAALALMRYGAFAHDDAALATSLSLLDALPPPASPAKERDPKLFEAEAAAAFALQMHLTPVPMAYIIADPGAGADSLVATALQANRPGRLVALHSPKDANLLYPAAGDGKPIVYVCSGEMCAPPSSSPQEVKDLLESFALPETAPDNPGGGRSPE